MGNPRITIIVPVYNVENYLKKCVDSIINQTYRNLEIVLVDDGSPDCCPEICDNFAKKDSRIKVIHKENGGLSSARNAGLRVAAGEYILFVDSDDWIHPETCEKLLVCAQETQCDIVHASYVRVIGNIETLVRNDSLLQHAVLSGKDFLVDAIRKESMSMSACCGLYKKDIIINNALFFEEGLLHEDELWTPQMYLAAEKVTYLEFAFYYYRENPQSITNARNRELHARRARDILLICDKLYPLYQNQQNEDRKILCDYLCMLYLNAVYVGNIKSAGKKFPLQTAHTLRNRIKALLHAISPAFYLWLNSQVKRRAGK